MKRFVSVCLVLILMVFTTPIVHAQTATEIEFWQSVKASDDIDMLKAYLQEYPDGIFRSLAVLKIKQLQLDKIKNHLCDCSHFLCLKETIDHTLPSVLIRNFFKKSSANRENISFASVRE